MFGVIYLPIARYLAIAFGVAGIILFILSTRANRMESPKPPPLPHAASKFNEY